MWELRDRRVHQDATLTVDDFADSFWWLTDARGEPVLGDPEALDAPIHQRIPSRAPSSVASFIWKRLYISANRREVDDQGVPDCPVIGALIVVCQPVTHPLDQ